MNCREAEPLLHARLDDELDMANLSGIDRHLSECRDCAARFTALQTLRAEIAAADLAYEPARAFERKLAARFLERKRPSFRLWGSIAAVAAALAIMVSVPMWRTGATDPVAAEILDDHLRALQPMHQIDVPSTDRHTVKPWFQGKTDFSPPVPDLSKDDFILAGGRLEVIHQQPAAAIVYRRRQHLISLYVSPYAGADSKPELKDLGGYRLLHWTHNNLSYWAVSDVNPDDLRTFAALVLSTER